MQESCTVNQTVRYLTKKWTLLIILELYKGDGYTRRFSDLKDSLAGITPKILSERLKEARRGRAYRTEGGCHLVPGAIGVHPDRKRP